MKKLLFSLIVTTLVAAALWANGSTESAAPAAKGKTVINAWTEDRHDLDYVQKKIDEFNKTNTSNIEIVLTVVAENYGNMLAMAYSSGTAPDIAGVSASSSQFDLKTFADAGIISPLTDYIKDPEFEKVTNASGQIIEGINAINSKPYWIPTAMRSGTRMIYNKKILDEVGCTKLPTTIAELATLADAITKKGNGVYYGLGTTSSNPIVRWFEGSCEKSGVLRYDFKAGKFDFSGYREPILAARKIFTNNSIFPGSPTQGVDAMRAQFAEGTFGIWANASQEAGVFTKQFPIKKFEWVVGELPSLDGTVRGTVSANAQKGYMLISSSKNKKAAWEVIKFFSSESYMKGYLESGYALPASKYMAGVIDASKTGRLADYAMKSYEGVYPSIPAVSIAGDAYSPVIWNAVMGLVDVDAAIKDLNTRYNEALDRDVSMGKIRRIIIRNFDPLKPSAGTIEYSTK